LPTSSAPRPPRLYALSLHDALPIWRLFDVDVFGQLAVIQAFLPMLHRSRGRIVNMSSVGAHIAIPFGGVLNACKAAFGTLSDTLDRKSTRLNSSHVAISYAVVCLKK